MSLAVIALTTAALATTGLVVAEEGMSYEERMTQELVFDEIEYSYDTKINEEYSYYLGEDDYYIEFVNGKDIDTFDYTMKYENKNEDMIYQYAINIIARNSLSSDDVKALENLRDAYDNEYILSDRAWDEATGIIEDYQEKHQVRGLFSKYNRTNTDVKYQWSGSKLYEIQYEQYDTKRTKNWEDTGRVVCERVKVSISSSKRWKKDKVCEKKWGRDKYYYIEQVQDGYNYHDTKTGVVKSVKEIGDIKPTLHGTKDLVNNVTSLFGATSKYKTDVVVEPNSIDNGSVYTEETIYYFENHSHIGTSNYRYKGKNNKGNTVIANGGNKFYGSGNFYQLEVSASAVISNPNIFGKYTRSMKGSDSTSIKIEFKTVSRPFGLFDSSFRKYYSCNSNDDFDCNYTKLSTISKLTSMSSDASGSMSEEQKDVVISYLATSYFAVDAMLFAIDAAEIAYWSSIAAGAITGGTSAVAAQLAFDLLVQELIGFGVGMALDKIVQIAFEYYFSDEISVYISNHSHEFRALWGMNEQIDEILVDLLFNIDEPNKKVDLNKFAKSFDSLRILIRAGHQILLYLDFIEMAYLTDLSYSDLFMINIEMSNNFNNGFSNHIIA